MRLQSRLDDREYQTEPARRAYSYRGLSALFHRVSSSALNIVIDIFTSVVNDRAIGEMSMFHLRTIVISTCIGTL